MSDFLKWQLCVRGYLILYNHYPREVCHTRRLDRGQETPELGAVGADWAQHHH